MSGKGTHEPSKGSGRAGADVRRASASTGTPIGRPEKIRNVALVGRSGSGKTTLAEALLAATGAITRMGSIVDGTTVSDSDPAEIHQQRSVALSVLPLMVGEPSPLRSVSGFPGREWRSVRAAGASWQPE